ncbi:MAG: aminopeptidase [Fusobacteriaceae bacterium]
MKNKLIKYAKLAVNIGVNIKKGDILVVNSPTETFEFTRYIVEEAYKLGAKEVVVFWNDDIVSKERYLYGSDDIFENIPQWQSESVEYYSKKGAAFLSISATDPTLLKDVDSTRVSTYNKLRRESLKPHYERLMSNKNKWCIISVPTKSWAQKVFPEVSQEKAVLNLWDSIFEVTRINRENPVEAWKEHNLNLGKKQEFLNKKQFKFLYYKNSLGTDLIIELPENHIWAGGGEKDEKGDIFVANIPTEEVFTLPKKTGVNGTVVSSKPLVYNGNIIENFKIVLSEGKIVEYYAEKGNEILKKLIETDNGSKYLGEVALVPFDSPISNSKIIFFNTLYDENASCHLAIGEAYVSCIENGDSLTEEEKEEKGVNTSLTHVDFMIGSSDLSIIGETSSGEKIEIFKNGNWAF